MNRRSTGFFLLMVEGQELHWRLSQSGDLGNFCLSFHCHRRIMLFTKGHVGWIDWNIGFSWRKVRNLNASQAKAVTYQIYASQFPVTGEKDYLLDITKCCGWMGRSMGSFSWCNIGRFIGGWVKAVTYEIYVCQFLVTGEKDYLLDTIGCGGWIGGVQVGVVQYREFHWRFSQSSDLRNLCLSFHRRRWGGLSIIYHQTWWPHGLD